VPYVLLRNARLCRQLQPLVILLLRLPMLHVNHLCRWKVRNGLPQKSVERLMACRAVLSVALLMGEIPLRLLQLVRLLLVVLLANHLCRWTVRNGLFEKRVERFCRYVRLSVAFTYG